MLCLILIASAAILYLHYLHWRKSKAKPYFRPSYKKVMTNPWRDLKGIPKEMWMLTIAVLVNRAGTMVLPFLMLYLTKAMQIPAQKASLALIAHGIGGVITAPLAGRLSDLIGAEKVMKISLILSGITLFFFPLIKDFYAIIGMVFIWSIVSEAFRPASMAIIGNLVPNEKLKAAFALNRLAINLGMSIGPALGGFLVYFSFSFIFIFDGVTSLIAGIILSLFLNLHNNAIYKTYKEASKIAPKDENLNENLAKNSTLNSNLSPIKNIPFLIFVAALIPIVLVFFQLESTAPLFLVRDLKLSEAIFGLLFSLNTLIIVFLEIPINSVTNAWPYNRSLALGCVLTAFGFGAMVFVTDAVSAAITVVIWTFGEMILFPSASAFVSEVSPTSKKGIYMGIYAMFFGLGATLAPIFGTYMLENYGASILWSTCLFFGILSSIVMLQIKLKTSK